MKRVVKGVQANPTIKGAKAELGMSGMAESSRLVNSPKKIKLNPGAVLEDGSVVSPNGKILKTVRVKKEKKPRQPAPPTMKILSME